MPEIEPEPNYEASLHMVLFSLAGMLIVVAFFAAIITAIVVFVSGWLHFTYSIFGFAWGISTRCFLFSVRAGVANTLKTFPLSTEKKKMLGEQLAMHRILRGFIRIELVGSAIVLAAELLGWIGP